MTAPILVFAWSNPSRGDDALGPLFAERAAAQLAPAVEQSEIEFLTDFQLQVEHALDLAGRRLVIFVDASLSCAAPFEYVPIAPAADESYSTHSLSPAALLHVARRVLDGPLPSAWLLAIRGECFELGEPLSESAATHLEAGLAFLTRRLAARDDRPDAPCIGADSTLQGG